MKDFLDVFLKQSEISAIFYKEILNFLDKSEEIFLKGKLRNSAEETSGTIYEGTPTNTKLIFGKMGHSKWIFLCVYAYEITKDSLNLYK